MQSDKNATTKKPAGRAVTPEKGAKVGVAQKILQQVFSISTATILGAIFLALILGAVIVAVFDPDVQEAASYFFARPSDTFAAMGTSFSEFFVSLFRGAILDTSASGVAVFQPLLESLTSSVPLMLAGLAIAVSFRAGLFNIGVQGQLIMGALLATIVGTHLTLPYGLHLLVAILAAIVGGFIWGAVPGLLKATMGANEVIVTIMMNSISGFLVAFMLAKPFMYGNGNAGKSSYVAGTAAYPLLTGSFSRLNLSIVVGILAAVFVWWLLERSTFGFELRAVGLNPHAAKTAGMSVSRVLFLTLAISGALAGLAGTAPTLGTERFLTSSTAGSLGFDSITVALLGKSTPLGTCLAALLFGALAAGSATMQASADIPVDIVQVTQAIIVLLIAASEAFRYYRQKRLVAKKTAAKTSKGEAK